MEEPTVSGDDLKLPALEQTSHEARVRIANVEKLAEDIRQRIKDEEKRLLSFDRFAKYPPSVNLDTVVAGVLGEESVPLDDETTALLLRALGPIAGPAIGLSSLRWLIAASWPCALCTGVYNSVLTLCDKTHDLESALQVYAMMKEQAAPADSFTFNLLISICRMRGEHVKAFELFKEMMDAEGVEANSFTYATLIEACNFRKGGHCDKALYAFKCLLDAGIDPPDFIRTELLSTIENGMARLSLEEALKVFEGLENVGMANNTRAYNAVLQATAREGEWVSALDIFQCMQNAGVLCNTMSYNAVLQACSAAGKAEMALEVFEWMVEGRGSDHPIEPDTYTYNTLIEVCQKNAMLEKALEIYAWMQGSGVSANSNTYDTLMGTVDVASDWDSKVQNESKPLKRSGARVRGGEGAEEEGGGARALEAEVLQRKQLRPAPFDGMRIIYMEQWEEKEDDERLAEIKLARTTWAPTSMKSPPSSSRPNTSHMNYPVVMDNSSRLGSSLQSFSGMAGEDSLRWSYGSDGSVRGGQVMRHRPPPLSAKDLVLGQRNNRYAMGR